MTDERERLPHALKAKLESCEEALRTAEAEIAALHSRLEAAEKDAHRLECALSEAIIVVDRHVEQFALGVGQDSDRRAWPIRDEYLHHWRKAVEQHTAALAPTPPGTGGDQPVCVGQREEK